jgi:hypothetical protein
MSFCVTQVKIKKQVKGMSHFNGGIDIDHLSGPKVISGPNL